MTKAVTDHANRTVTFNDSALNFTVACPNSNPLDVFPQVTQTNTGVLNSGNHNSKPDANATCLSNSLPPPSQPQEPIRLHHGFNVVTLCLVMTASLLGSSLFSLPLWLEGREVTPSVHVVSVPISKTCFSSHTKMSDPPASLLHYYPKCRPSRMLSAPETQPTHTRFLGFTKQFRRSLFRDTRFFYCFFSTNVMVKCNKNKSVLPPNAFLGNFREQKPEDESVYSEAVDTTASQLADIWFAYANSVQFPSTGSTPNQSSDILQHSQNRPTGDRWLKF